LFGRIEKKSRFILQKRKYTAISHNRIVDLHIIEVQGHHLMVGMVTDYIFILIKLDIMQYHGVYLVIFIINELSKKLKWYYTHHMQITDDELVFE
jgi:hypothetical protein